MHVSQSNKTNDSATLTFCWPLYDLQTSFPEASCTKPRTAWQGSESNRRNGPQTFPVLSPDDIEKGKCYNNYYIY